MVLSKKITYVGIREVMNETFTMHLHDVVPWFILRTMVVFMKIWTVARHGATIGISKIVYLAYFE